MRLLFAGTPDGAADPVGALGDAERLAWALADAGIETSFLTGGRTGGRILRIERRGLVCFESQAPARDLPVLAATLRPALVVCFGADPAGLAVAAAATGTPACAWLRSSDLAGMAGYEADHRIGIMAGDPVTRGLAASLLGRPVGLLPPPTTQAAAGDQSVLVPSIDSADGAVFALSLARERPQLRFRWLAGGAAPERIAAFARRLPANGTIDRTADRAMAVAARLVLAPRGPAGPLATLLAAQLAAGAGILAGDGELAALLGVPGLSVTASSDEWLAAIDHGAQPIVNARALAGTLRPQPAVAAMQAVGVLKSHLASVVPLAAGRL